MRAVNLLPRAEPRRRTRMTLGVQLALVAPFVVGSLLFAGYLVSSSKVNDDRATLKALQDELAALPPPVTAPETNAQLALQHGQRVSALASALQTRVAWDRILREISSILPEDVWLTALSAQSPQTAVSIAPPPSQTTTTESDGGTTTTAPPTTPTPVPSSGTPLSLAGYTYSQEGVARFLSRLAVIPELQDVKLVTSSQTLVSGRVVVQFSIRAGIRRQAAA